MENIIQEYDRAERSGALRLTPDLRSAFKLEVFDLLGFTHRVGTERDLRQFVDTMHDARLERNLKLLTHITDTQVDLCMRASRVIASYSKKQFGIELHAPDSLSRALYQYQLLERELEIVPHPWTVLEIGPGSGYLGLLLGLAGHQYIAVEAAQALFLHQRNVWRFAFQNEYSDGFSDARYTRIRHLPWWRFADSLANVPELDLVTCNHAIAELNPRAFQRVLHVLTSCGSASAVLLAETLGDRRLRSSPKIAAHATSMGFSIEIRRRNVWIFKLARSAKPRIEAHVALPKRERFHYWRAGISVTWAPRNELRSKGRHDVSAPAGSAVEEDRRRQVRQALTSTPSN